MKKTVGLGLLAILVAGLMSNAAFADIRYLNNYDRPRYQVQQRYDQHVSFKQRQIAERHRIAELRRLAEKRRKAEQQYLKRLQKARLADARYDRYDRRYDQRWDQFSWRR